MMHSMNEYVMPDSGSENLFEFNIVVIVRDRMFLILGRLSKTS